PGLIPVNPRRPDSGHSGRASRRAALVARLDSAEQRLEQLAVAEPRGLTEPDPPTGERWEAGQVWAHVAEFPSYWLDQIRQILAADPARQPIPFGRTKTDRGRLAAIERDRHEPPAALLVRASTAIAEARDFVERLELDRWSARGLHPTLGEMDVSRILDEFIVRHLEEHADQLERLASSESDARAR
ncbi:MAG: DinB family protein, partial [Chloroflexota bacterium]|nr:DinB family protein [Chloroflexota bacterium]